jgi:hypothetical protein
VPLELELLPPLIPSLPSSPSSPSFASLSKENGTFDQ